MAEYSAFAKVISSY